ncbi:unnamed protein product [Timema podura]|uniref:Uncharacterized protein n=1 Tax=Timema podura TaxID=61482 RepID=A0ABN7NR15_TIMPD|nr:unnamed protein product [Timema podura]
MVRQELHPEDSVEFLQTMQLNPLIVIDVHPLFLCDGKHCLNATDGDGEDVLMAFMDVGKLHNNDDRRKVYQAMEGYGLERGVTGDGRMDGAELRKLENIKYLGSVNEEKGGSKEDLMRRGQQGKLFNRSIKSKTGIHLG